jgi:hypothetical protein
VDEDIVDVEVAAAVVTILKVDPGSTMSVIARLRRASIVLCSMLLRSKLGRLARARISPVCGRMRMQVAILGRNCLTAASSSLSTICWMAMSMVNRT